MKKLRCAHLKKPAKSKIIGRSFQDAANAPAAKSVHKKKKMLPTLENKVKTKTHNQGKNLKRDLTQEIFNATPRCSTQMASKSASPDMETDNN